MHRLLRFAPDLVAAVISSAVPLDAAYATATDRKRAAEGPAVRLDVLRKRAPDLVPWKD
jgi:hypothetical protein